MDWVKNSFSPLALSVVVLLGLIGFGTWYFQQNELDEQSKQIAELNRQVGSSQADEAQQSYTLMSQKGVTVEVYKPLRGSKVTNPVEVVGKVPGNWSFEADFPVELKDATGKVLVESPAGLLSDWMTEELVLFTVNLKYVDAASGEGLLILHKDNPSGLPENDDRVTIPIVF